MRMGVTKCRTAFVVCFLLLLSTVVEATTTRRSSYTTEHNRKTNHHIRRQGVQQQETASSSSSIRFLQGDAVGSTTTATNATTTTTTKDNDDTCPPCPQCHAPSGSDAIQGAAGGFDEGEFSVEDPLTLQILVVDSPGIITMGKLVSRFQKETREKPSKRREREIR